MIQNLTRTAGLPRATRHRLVARFICVASRWHQPHDILVQILRRDGSQDRFLFQRKIHYVSRSYPRFNRALILLSGGSAVVAAVVCKRTLSVSGDSHSTASASSRLMGSVACHFSDHMGTPHIGAIYFSGHRHHPVDVLLLGGVGREFGRFLRLPQPLGFWQTVGLGVPLGSLIVTTLMRLTKKG